MKLVQKKPLKPQPWGVEADFQNCHIIVFKISTTKNYTACKETRKYGPYMRGRRQLIDTVPAEASHWTYYIKTLNL